MVKQLSNAVIKENQACILIQMQYGNCSWWRCKLLPEHSLFPLSPVGDYADCSSVEELNIWCDIHNLNVKHIVPHEKARAYYACACHMHCNEFIGA